MSDDDRRDLDESRASVPLAHGFGVRAADPGRCAVFALIGGTAGAVPLPWVPDAILRRVRGALVHDLARQHRLTLPREARDVLSEPSGTEGPRGFFGHVSRFVTGKVLSRLGPAALFPPVRTTLETFVLGHLFERYLSVARTSRGRRIDVLEARRVRRAIDRALVTALTVDVPLPTSIDSGPGDDRDAFTAVVDRILSRTADVPGWITRRLDAAFDELLPKMET